MNFSEEVKTGLWAMIDEMSNDTTPFTMHPGKDFSRKKKWDFASVMKFIISMEGKSLKDELLKYFEYSSEHPTNSSFNQRRAQIKPEAFEYLFRAFLSKYNNNDNLYQGYKLIACDGSDINIAHNPDDTETYFQNGSKARGYNQLHLNALYDLQNRMYIDAVIQPARLENEHGAFCDMVDRYEGVQKTVFIVDRGYESYNNIAHVNEKGLYYLFRVKDKNSSGILSGLKLPDEDEYDVTISIQLTRKCTKEVLSHPEIYKCSHKKEFLDFIDLDKNPFYLLEFRVLRFPVSGTEYECIITNLPSDEFTGSDIKILYGMRWGIETSFRELKYAVGMTCFHSKKVGYIKQEIWARMLLYNFCEVITTHVSIEKCERKHIYQVNYTIAIHICRYFLSKMAEKSPPDVEALISKEILPVRPGRHNPRKADHQRPFSFLYRAS